MKKSNPPVIHDDLHIDAISVTVQTDTEKKNPVIHDDLHIDVVSVTRQTKIRKIIPRFLTMIGGHTRVT